ncbi:MAG TPA: class I SAM-dependent methyltransferase [Clostridia bacterium]|nr:class I SAM-dependent methyltransferase [Clostridia bacterium]
MLSHVVKEQYNSLSFFYNVLYAGFESSLLEEVFTTEHHELLKHLRPNAEILDASCGNGIQSTALAKKGYNITACDISEEMIELTRKYAKKHGVDYPTIAIGWHDLPEYFDEKFDLIFCWGNSISHSLNEEEMIQTLKAFYSVIKPGGTLVVETRNWDQLIRNKTRFETLKLRIYNGKMYIPFYIWNLNGFNNPANVEIIFTELKDNNETKCCDFKLDFTPFEHKDLVNRLEKVGFSIYDDNFQDAKDHYYIVAKKYN